LLAPAAGLADSSNDLFLLGLISATDAILDMKMDDVLKELTLREEIRNALLGAQNTLRRVFDIVLLYEAGAWDELKLAASALKIGEDVVPGIFVESVDWARNVLGGQPVGETEPA
jgi:c-di-GMP phosphodiesterase